MYIFSFWILKCFIYIQLCCNRNLVLKGFLLRKAICYGLNSFPLVAMFVIAHNVTIFGERT